ncbi:MAG: DUF222 domain-containing protein [Acidothermaceae bacterium]
MDSGGFAFSAHESDDACGARDASGAFDVDTIYDVVDGWPADSQLPSDAAQVALLSEYEPGPTAMLVLAGIDASALDVDGRVEFAAAWQRQLAWVDAKAQAALAASVEDVDPELPSGNDVAEMQWRAELVAASLGWSPTTAANRLSTAQRVLNDLPNMFGLLEAGEVSLRHVLALAHEVFELTPQEIAAVEARVIERAPIQTPAQFTRSVRRAVIAVAPEAAAVRRARALRSRGVRKVAYPDGMAAVIATMDAADAETVYLALDAAARKAAAADGAPGNAAAADGSVGAAGGSAPSIYARRADALLVWANDALADPDLPRKQGRRVEVQVVIDLPTLLGAADNPAELIDYGPITSGAARELAADAAWRRLVVDPVDGHLLDYGTTVYRPPQKLADYLVARDRRCRFPGCGRQGDGCDFDHVIPFGTPGGVTAARNCCCLCRYHHRMKTHGGWRLQLHEDSSVTWTSPTGRTFHVDPTGQLE